MLNCSDASLHLLSTTVPQLTSSLVGPSSFAVYISSAVTGRICWFRWHSSPHSCDGRWGALSQLHVGGWGIHPPVYKVMLFSTSTISESLKLNSSGSCLVWSYSHCLAVDSCDHGLQIAVCPFLWGNPVSNKEASLILAPTLRISWVISCPEGCLSIQALENIWGHCTGFLFPQLFCRCTQPKMWSQLFLSSSMTVVIHHPSFIFLHTITSVEQKYTSAAHLSANPSSSSK